jgi:hypothetical protein
LISHDPLSVARQAQNMARNAHADAPMFQRVALVSMIVIATAGATQMMLQIIRELRRENHERSR